MSEDSKINQKVIAIKAIDCDSGENARIHYTFDGGDDGGGDFSIGSTSGIIRTNNM